jgi:hypothetical protein
MSMPLSMRLGGGHPFLYFVTSTHSMEDISLVADHYKNLHTAELVNIAKDPAGLRPEVIPVLQKELLSRNEPEVALELSHYLVHGHERLNNLSPEALQESINQRLASGETLDSIKIDLRDNGVDIFDIINYDSQKKEKTFEYMVALKDQGFKGQELSDKLQETFAIKEEETEILKAQLKSKGRKNLVIGFSMVIVVSIFMLVAAGSGLYPGIGAIILFALGIWRIIEGLRQTK